MADVLLTVGVNPNLDFSQFERDLNAIFSKYEKGNKHKLNVNIGIDKDAVDSLNDISAELKNIQSETKVTVAAINNLSTALQNMGGTGGSGKGKGVSKGMEEFRKQSKAIADYYATLKKYSSLSTNIEKDAQTGKFVSAGGEWANLANELNRVEQEFNDVSAAIKKLQADASTKSLGDKLEAQLKSATSQYNMWVEERNNKVAAENDAAYKKRADMVVRLEKQEAVLRSKIQNVLSNYSAANGSTKPGSSDAYNSVSKYIAQIDKLKPLLNGSEDDLKTFRSELEKIDTSLNNDTRTIRANGDAHKSWGKTFTEVTSRLSAYFTASQMITQSIRAFKEMIRESVAVDSAMTQMQIVTKASAAEMEKFGDAAAKSAKKTASSITDIVDSATTYARLGYDSNTSTTLAEYTSMLSKVGDIDVASVQSAVTAIVKAFKIDASDADAVEAVFDKLVKTGNNLPVSVAELAEGLNNAGSALAAAGNTYEESLGLLAATNATVQDISKSSTGLRTLVARIRNTKTELDSLGESMTTVEYDNIVKSLTKYNVSLTDSAGNLRDSYDIFRDIARVAQDLKQNSPNEYAALAEILAGTRQQNVFYSLVENFNEAEKAMRLMGESSGELESSFATYADSMAAHIQQFKTQFQELSSAVIGSNLANKVVDIGTGFLEFATNVTKAGNAIPALIAGFAAFKGAKSIF